MLWKFQQIIFGFSITKNNLGKSLINITCNIITVTFNLWNLYTNKAWRYPIKQLLYGHLPPITRTIQIRQTRHAGHCWRSKDELISNLLLWTPSHRRAKVEQPARTYLQQFCANIGCCLEDLLEQWTIETGGKRGSWKSVCNMIMGQR